MKAKRDFCYGAKYAATVWTKCSRWNLWERTIGRTVIICRRHFMIWLPAAGSLQLRTSGQGMLVWSLCVPVILGFYIRSFFSIVGSESGKSNCVGERGRRESACRLKMLVQPHQGPALSFYYLLSIPPFMNIFSVSCHRWPACPWNSISDIFLLHGSINSLSFVI